MSVEKIKEQVASTKEMLASGFTFLVSVDCESDLDTCVVEDEIWDKLYKVGLSKIKAYEEVHRDGNGYESNYWLWFENEDDFIKSAIDSKVVPSVLVDGEWPPEVKVDTVPFPIHLVKA